MPRRIRSASSTAVCCILLYVVLLAAGSGGAAGVPLPLSESFDSLNAPGAPAWSFDSTANGMIKVVGDTAATSEWTDFAFPSSSMSTPQANIFAGNHLLCTRDSFMLEQDIYLDNATPSTITVLFRVYERDKAGNYLAVAETAASAPRGASRVSSGPMPVALHAGRRYLLGVGWASACSYSYRNSVTTNSPLGSVSQSCTYTTTANPPLNLETSPTLFNRVMDQRVLTTQEGVLRMDAVTGGTVAVNAATLHLDLEGIPSVPLSFRHRGSSDGANAGDGVFVSADGTSFVNVLTPNGASSTWQSYTVDVAVAAAMLGVTVSSDTQVRFGQEGAYAWNGSVSQDGREWDDIDVTIGTDLDYVNLAVTAHGPSYNPIYFRGTSTDKEIHLDSEVVWRMGETGVAAVAIRESLLDGQTEVTGATRWLLNLDPLDSGTSTLHRVLVIPAATKLTRAAYTIRGVADYGDAVQENQEANNTNEHLRPICHYSGKLFFGDIATDVTVTDFEASYGSDTDHVLAGTGTWNGAGFSFSDLYCVRDLATLDYTVAATDINTVHVYPPIEQETANVRFILPSGVVLDKNGAHADVIVALPVGFGVTERPDSKMLSALLYFPGLDLDQSMVPKGPVVLTQDFYWCEETKPFLFHSDVVTWHPGSGRFEFAPGDVIYTRGDELDSLDFVAAMGWLLRPEDATHYSNDDYYRYALFAPTGAVVRADADGAALLDIGVEFEAQGTNRPFLPFGVTNIWSEGGAAEIVGDRIVPGPGCGLFGASSVSVPYDRNCPKEVCGDDAVPGVMTIFPADDFLALTADGGLWATGSTFVASRSLRWGAYDGDYAQRAESFSHATVFIPGHFTKADQFVHPSLRESAPATILLSGVMPHDLTAMERFGSPMYWFGGFGDYAGANLRAVGGDKTGRSRIGGEVTPNYPLTTRSKYYVRRSGVSGIHEALQPLTWTDLHIYGYSFTFSNYGLSYLSNRNIESRTQGEIYLPYPSDFTLPFEDLTLSCLGQLEDARVVDGTTARHMSYWNADIDPLSIHFAPHQAAPCGVDERFLTVGMQTRCGTLDQPLSGLVGFLPDGDLVSPADNVEGVDSRLMMPAQMRLAGAEGDAYTLTPVSRGYLNRYAGRSSDDDGVGHISLAGTLDVPFFTDLPIHIGTSASTSTLPATAVIEVAGGWEEGGATFFNTALVFDEWNDGHPAGVTDADYWRDALPYRVHALRNWQEMLDMDYPLSWSWASRSFSSFTPVDTVIAVVPTQTTVDYMGTAAVELSFGEQTTLPQLNLANIGINAAGPGEGMAAAFMAGTSAATAQRIRACYAALDELLSDLPAPLFGPVMDARVNPRIEAFYDEISLAYAAHPSDPKYYVDPLGIGMATVWSALEGMVADHNGGDVASVIQTDYLPRVRAMLDALDGDLLDPSGGSYPALEPLAYALLREMAPDMVAAMGTEAQVRALLRPHLAVVAPALTALKASLSDLHNATGWLNNLLEEGAGLQVQLEVAATHPGVEASTEQAEIRIAAFLDSLPGKGLAFDQFTPAEMQARFRQIIEDEYYGSAGAAGVQAELRNHFYDLNASARAAADALFQQLNVALRRTASAHMQGLDTTFTKLAGSVGDAMAVAGENGYAHIKGDSLPELRIDGRFQLACPHMMEFTSALIFRDQDSVGPETTCGGGLPGSANTVVFKADDTDLDWMSPELRANVEARLSFDAASGDVLGLYGSFEMTGGTLSFESFEITELSAAMAVGQAENFLTAAMRARMSGSEASGGIFLGKTCTLEPLALWASDVAGVLGAPPFNGIYVYGEAWGPIVDYGCVFNLSGGMGLGIFYFVDGPFGGKMLTGLSGEALCAISVRGEQILIGSKNGSDLIMVGKGRVSGKVGKCPVCKKFKKTVTLTYRNGNFDADW